MDGLKTGYPYRLGDMISGAITHGIGALLSIVGMIVLLVAAYDTHGALAIIGAFIFGLSLVLSYASSTLYHALVRTRARRVFHIFDHCLIYLLIAGTYTPLILFVLKGSLGWVMLSVVWLLAAAGIVYKSFAIGKHPAVELAFYLIMGWLALIFIVPLWHVLPGSAVMLLIAGGLSYTLGLFFFVFDRIPHFHSIWHLFVLAGSAFHYFLILRYIIK